jgi:hypothetical protein
VRPIVPLRQPIGVARGDNKPPTCEHRERRFAGADYGRKATKWRCPMGKCKPAQLRALARFGGRQPVSYRLGRDVNCLPESLPLDFPHGTSGPCFAHPSGGIVVLPNGCGFALA